MHEAKEDVLAFRHFPQPHWKKVWSTNLLERVNEQIKRCSRVVGIFPNDAAIIRLVGAVLLEQHEHWQLEGRRMFSPESMAAIPEQDDIPALQALSSLDHLEPATATPGCVNHSGSQHIGDRSKDLTENAPIHRGYQRRICTSGATARPSPLATC